MVSVAVRILQCACAPCHLLEDESVTPASTYATVLEWNDHADGQHSSGPVGLFVGFVDKGAETGIVIVYEIS